MIVPTRTALLLLAVASLPALLGYVTPFALDLTLTIDAVLVAVIAVDAWRAAPPKAVTVRRAPPVGFSAGRETTVGYEWHNGSRNPARLTVRELRPEILGGLQPVRTLLVPAGTTQEETRAVHPIRRGHEVAGWLAVRSRGPLGLAVRQRLYDIPWEVTVLPTIPSSRLKASLTEAMKRREAGLRAVRSPGQGRTFESLREWVPGDDTRHIDWKASARRRKLITRLYEEERRQQVLLVLDAGRLLTAEIGGKARLEYTVSAALALAFAATRHGDNVGVMVFADTVQHFVSPQRGRDGLSQVLDVLARVTPSLVEPDYPGAFRYLATHNRKRALTVVFTDVIDAAASSALVANTQSLARRHLPLAVTIRNPELDTVATSRPKAEFGAYRKAAAEELLTAREGALAQMRRAGAVVIDVPPEDASVSVVDKYVELKRRGRL